MTDYIVSAAMYMDDGLIVPGVRHYSPEMRAVLRRIYGDGYHLRVAEQGFITNAGQFVDREVAYAIADAAGQLRRDVGTKGAPLFSEHLY